MKIQPIALLILPLLILPRLTAAQCYLPLRSEGVVHLRQENYKEAINRFFSARHCPDKPQENDLDDLLKKAMEAWELKLTGALEEAQAQTRLALQQKEAAEHLAHASNNSALAIRLLRENPTLALRVADRNYDRYPDNEAAAVALRETLNSGQPFYKKEIEGPTYVTSVAFLPDGRHFLVGRRGGMYDPALGHALQLYDLDGNLVRSLMTTDSLDRTVEDIAVSADGRLILTGTYSDSLAVLRTIEGELVQIFEGLGAESVALSPDGQLALVVGSFSAPRLLEVASGKVLRTFGEFAADNVNFAPDGQHVLIRESETSSLWTLEGDLIAEFWHEAGFYIHGVDNAFSKDGRHFATGGTVVRVWDMEGNPVAELTGHQGYVKTVAFSPDGQYLVGGSTVGELFIWDLNGRVINQLTGHHELVTSVDFSPDGRHILSASSDLTVKLWSWNKGSLQRLDRFPQPVYDMAFSPDGQRLLSSHMDGQMIAWDLANGELEYLFLGSEPMLTGSSAFSPDGRLFLTGTADSTAVLWDMSSGTKQHTLYGHRSIAGFDSTLYESNVMSVAFSHDGTRALTGSSDRTVKLWDLDSKALLRTYTDPSGGLYALAFSPDDQTIYFSSKDRTVKRYDLAGNLLQSYAGHFDWINCLDISPDGQYLVSGGFDGKILLHHTDGTLLYEASLPETIISDVTFFSDGQSFLTASSDGKGRLWNLRAQELQVFPGGTGVANCAVFSPDGRHVAVGDDDGAIRIWPVKDVILDEQVADIPLPELLNAGMTFSEADLQRMAAGITDPATLVTLYKYSRKEGLSIDILPLVTRHGDLGDINGLIRAFVADLQAFTHENILAELTGKKENQLAMFAKIRRLIDAAAALDPGPEERAEYTDILNQYGWEQLLTGDFTGAEASIRRGLELDPTNPYLYTNLPPALLLQGRYETAEAMYREYAPLTFEPQGRPYAGVFLDDFADFERAGVVPAEHREKVEALKAWLDEMN